MKKNQLTALFTMEMRTRRGPHYPAACSLFPDDQDPDPGAHGQCALREDGRKRMTGHVPPGPKPT